MKYNIENNKNCIIFLKEKYILYFILFEIGNNIRSHKNGLFYLFNATNFAFKVT